MKVGDQVVCIDPSEREELVYGRTYIVTMADKILIAVSAHTDKLFSKDRFLKLEKDENGYVTYVRDKKIDHMALVRQIALEWRE